MGVAKSKASCPLILALLLALPTGFASGDAAVRPDGLIFNEALKLDSTVAAQWPFYVTRRGEYYVEVTLERDADSGDRPEAREMAIDLRIARRDRELMHRNLDTTLGAVRPAQTLGWFTSDREVPIKSPLRISLVVKAPGSEGETLRVQVRRKLNTYRPR